MTGFTELVPGKEINLVVVSGEHKGRYLSYVSRRKDKTIEITAPLIEGVHLSLAIGTKVAVSFWDDVCAYMFETKVLRCSEALVPIYELGMPENCLKIQRREYVRVPAVFPVFYHNLTKDKADKPRKWKQTHSLDLSGGGVRFLTDEQLEQDQVLNICLRLPQVDIDSLARICRLEKTRNNYHWIVSVQFVSLPERERDEVIRCVFDIQREMRRKGLV